jgi:putative transposase
MPHEGRRPALGTKLHQEAAPSVRRTGQARHLNFACYRRDRFLDRDRTRAWFRDALETARRTWQVELWAYVLMPEHVHLLVFPRRPEASVSGFLGDLKEAVGRVAITHLRQHAPEWLPRLVVHHARSDTIP